MIQTNEAKELDIRLKLGRPHSLRLFVSPHNASVMTTLSDLKEMVTGGYKPIQLIPNRWSIKGAKASYPETAFTFTAAGGFVYGVFMLDDEAKVVRFVETFAEPFYVRQRGDTLTVGGFTVEC